MASSFCTKCGAALIPEKRFCTQCGQSVGQAKAASDQPTAQRLPVPESDSATRSDPALEKALAVAVGGTQAQENSVEPSSRVLPPIEKDKLATVANSSGAPVSEAFPVSALTVVGTKCSKCGSLIHPGKRFCASCGEPVARPATIPIANADTQRAQPNLDSPKAPVTPLSADALATTPIENPSGTENPDPGIPEHVLSASNESQTESFTASADSEDRVDEVVVQLPVSAESGSFSSESPAQRELTPKKSSRQPLLLAGAAVCVLLVGIGAWLHVSRAKPVLLAVPAPASTASQNAPLAGRTSENDKPSAATPGGGEASVLRNSAKETQQVKTAPKIFIEPPKVDTAHRDSREVIVADATPKGSKEHPFAPASQSSGTLHYAGPPVRYGERVTFTGLPAARLKFAFDHQAWQPLISRQPDGTKTLALRSLKKGEQTSCDVGWEVVSESADGEQADRTSEKCDVLPSDISNYLDRADRNRAAGHYDDAGRQYRKVIECDHNNARARQGLERTSQAQSASGRSISEDDR